MSLAPAAPPVRNTDDITVVCACSSCRGTILLRTGTDFYSGSNNNMALLPCVEEIEQKFGQLEGITFRGFFIGEHYVEQTDNLTYR